MAREKVGLASWTRYSTTPSEITSRTGLSENKLIAVMFVFVCVYASFMVNNWILESAKGPGVDDEIARINRSSWPPKSWYREWLEHRLTWIDVCLETAPCSVRSYVFRVKLALMYTVVSVLLIWIVFEADTLVLQNILVPAAAHERLMCFLGSATMIVCSYIYSRRTPYERWTAFIIAACTPLLEMLSGPRASTIVMAAVASFAVSFLLHGGVLLRGLLCVWCYICDHC
jgi:hypothetical protein